MKKKLPIILLILIVIGGIFFWWRFYFTFGEGVKAGNLNYLVYKGYVFKTWEGRLIQDGFQTTKPGALQSNEFRFSVTNDSLARVLETAGGKYVELRYKEYLGAIPWRGVSKYVVTDIIVIEKRPRNTEENDAIEELPYN